MLPGAATGEVLMLPDIDEAERFLRALGRGAKAFTFQTFDDSAAKRRSAARILEGSLADHEHDLTLLNVDGAGVFVTVNETDGNGRLLRNFTRVRALWQEDDKGAGAPGEGFPAPHIVVESSPGKFHRYWLVNGFTPADHEAAMRTMVDRFGSDRGVIDLVRVLRLPGFYHRKGSPFRVRLDFVARDCTPYLLDTFRPWLDYSGASRSAERVEAGTVVKGVDREDPQIAEWCADYVAKHAPSAGEGERNKTGFKVAGKLYGYGASHETALASLLDWNADKCSPPMEDAEIETIARSAQTSRQDAIGIDNPWLGFEDIGEAPPYVSALRRSIVRYRDRPEDVVNIPRIPWLAPRRLIKRELTVLVAPGSSGKSLLTLQWAIALALGPDAGEDLACGLKVNERTKVLVVNHEDSSDTMRMRVAAICQQFGLDQNELYDRIFFQSKKDADRYKLTLAAKAPKSHAIVATEDAREIVEICKEEGIGCIVFDPLGKIHDCAENDNAEMQKAIDVIENVAVAANVPVVINHHTSKPSNASAESFAGNPNAARGASALVNSARIALTMFTMSPQDAEKHGVPEHERHLFKRLDDAKANLFLASPVAEWFKLQTVHLPNGEDAGVCVPHDFRLTDGAKDQLVLEVLAGAMKAGQTITLNRAGEIVLSSGRLENLSSVGGCANHVKRACGSKMPIAGGLKFQFVATGKSAGKIICTSAI